MASLERIVADGKDILYNGLTEVVDGVIAAIETLLRENANPDGTVDIDNVAITNRLRNIWYVAFDEDVFQRNIPNFIRKIDEVREENVRIHELVNGIDLSDQLLDEAEVQMRDLVRQFLSRGWIDRRLALPMRTYLSRLIVRGTTIEQMTRVIERDLRGNPIRTGNRLYSYATLVARDTVGQYNGTINMLAAQEYGLEYYAYRGSLVQDSRDQCKRWVGKRYLKITELEEEIQWARENGSGMIPGTTPANFAVFRGGYNCRHEAIAVRQPTEATTEILNAN